MSVYIVRDNNRDIVGVRKYLNDAQELADDTVRQYLPDGGDVTVELWSVVRGTNHYAHNIEQVHRIPRTPEATR